MHIIYTRDASLQISEKTAYAPITDPNYFLQAMSIDLPSETEVKAHKHNPQERDTTHTHEATFIFKGKVALSIYDTDNTFVEKVILKEGDCSIIINGGHSFKTLEPTSLFEFKNGPYFGPEKDRTYF